MSFDWSSRQYGWSALESYQPDEVHKMNVRQGFLDILRLITETVLGSQLD